MINVNDVVQFTENHKWVGCFGYVEEVKEREHTTRYMIGVPIPSGGTAYIFDNGNNIEKVGEAVLIPDSGDGYE